MVDGARIKEELDRGQVVIVLRGFKASLPPMISPLSGGADRSTTAVAVAAALDAEVCEIYTDVDGVYSADPRLVPEARKLVEVDYGEMLELASLGAMVLQPRAVEV